MSQQLLASKIVIVEEEPRLRQVPSVPTAVVGMIGVTERGPVAVATFVTSFEQYVNIYGGFTATGDAAVAAEGFFLNGGSQMWVVRTVHFTDILVKASATDVQAKVTLLDRDSGTPLATLDVSGKTGGTFANSLDIVIANATSTDADEFNLQVVENGVIQETFPNLSMTDTDDNYVESVINDVDSGSNLISVLDLDSATASPDDLPALGTFGLDDTTAGDDGLASLADTDFTGSAAGETGIHSLDPVLTVTILIVPGQATSAVHNKMISYCEVDRELSCFAILDPPSGLDGPGIVTYVVTTAALLNLSEQGAIYWPRVKVLNPDKAVFGTADQITVAPSGYIAGLYARVDGSSPGGVFKPPAGIENGRIFGVLGFETDEVKKVAVRDLVFPQRINPISVEPGAPRFIDGARTLKGNGNFPGVAEKRGAIFIEQSIKQGLLFAKHQNNNEALRESVARTVTAFLLIQMNNDAFRSKDPAKAFFVDFGTGLNTPTTIFNNQLIGRIGIATQKATEFIILRFSQDTRAIEAEIQGAGAV